jgi:hypothetical protein
MQWVLIYLVMGIYVVGWEWGGWGWEWREGERGRMGGLIGRGFGFIISGWNIIFVIIENKFA